ncbi:MAG: DAK2 domain-containing protein [Solirubrobacterales bacterium]
MRDAALHRFRQVVGVALRHLEARQQEINDLNVFPVADGDTGDNMVLTMRYVLEELKRLEEDSDADPDRPVIVHAVARAALMGARGNSGVILSQIVRGAAEVLATPPGRMIDPELIESAMGRASENAYRSVREPAEGTMLTVMAKMHEAVKERLAHWQEHRLEPEATDEEQNALLAEMIAAALSEGEKALRQTPEQLPVLVEYGVETDAGALGLVVIVRGMMSGLLGEQVALPEIPHYEPARITDVHHADSRYRWCTNFIVTGTRLDADSYAPRLEELGDSVLVVGDEETLKVHVHTDDPDAAKSIFSGAVAIEREDIADMHEQMADHRVRLASGRSAVVAVVSGDGMRKLFEEAGVIVVDGGPTLNPATNDLLRAIEACPADEVVVLPNSSNVVLAAREAAELADKPVEVVDCDSQQAGVVALVAIKPELDAKANAARLADELATVRTAAIAEAARDDAGGRFVRGETVGFVGGEIVAWGETESTLEVTMLRITDGAEIVTAFKGADSPIPVSEVISHAPPGVEVEDHDGGQPHYWWLLAAQ